MGIKHVPKTPKTVDHTSFVTFFLTSLGFYILILVGLLSKLLFPRKVNGEVNRDGYPPLFDNFVLFYIQYIMRRIGDSYNFIVCSIPGAEIVIKDRVSNDNCWTLTCPGTVTKCLNLGSYNYLGFAENHGDLPKSAIQAIHTHGISTCSSRQHFGSCVLHTELEQLTAEYLGVDDAITFGMGFATNVVNLPIIISEGCLVLSDCKNHASLILGIRLSGATIKIFKHNDVNHLEILLQEAIVNGQSQKEGVYVPWKKMLIIVEGIYSMEGTMVRLPEIIALKKRYKAYLYVDEAHSMGALGKSGRGVIEYFGCNPRDIDILMGTFTKSFAAAGGYIAGSREFISHLRKYSLASKYAISMSPPVAGQIIAVLKTLMGRDGKDLGRQRIEALARNTKYFRRRLTQIGVMVTGHDDSPVVPILTYSHSKASATVKKLLQRKIAVVGVGFPAAPLLQARIRICLSAVHTKEQLDYALRNIDEVAEELGLKYSRKPRIIPDINYYNL